MYDIIGGDFKLNYNVEDARKATKYMESGMAPTTVAIILSRTSEQKYTADDINYMVSELRKNPPPSGNGRLYDAAAGIVFNKSKRKRIGLIALLVFLLFVVGMMLLGFLVSWVPVLITVGILFVFILIVITAFFVMIKTGFLERCIEKYNT